MQTQLLGHLDVEQARIEEDVEASTAFHLQEPYSDFLVGRPWKTCTLWAADGEAGDGVISHYAASRPRGFTDYGNRLPYLRDLIERWFVADHLILARLATMSASVLIPHRDYVELDDVPEAGRAKYRLHVPLVTSEDCYFSEDDVVYQMRPGEVWCLAAARQHGAAVLSEFRRTHLILDFADAGGLANLVRFPVQPTDGVPPHSVCTREPLSERDQRSLLALADVIDHDTVWDVLSIVIKKHYRHDGRHDFTWRTVDRIAELSGDDTLHKRVRKLHRYYTLERDE